MVVPLLTVSVTLVCLDHKSRALANKWWLLTTHLSASLWITLQPIMALMNPSKTEVMMFKKVKCFKELTLMLTSHHVIVHVSLLSQCWRNFESFSELTEQHAKITLFHLWQAKKFPFFLLHEASVTCAFMTSHLACCDSPFGKECEGRTSPTQLAFSTPRVSKNIDVSTGYQADSGTSDQAHFSFLR